MTHPGPNWYARPRMGTAATSGGLYARSCGSATPATASRRVHTATPPAHSRYGKAARRPRTSRAVPGSAGCGARSAGGSVRSNPSCSPPSWLPRRARMRPLHRAAGGEVGVHEGRSEAHFCRHSESNGACVGLSAGPVDVDPTINRGPACSVVRPHRRDQGRRICQKGNRVLVRSLVRVRQYLHLWNRRSTWHPRFLLACKTNSYGERDLTSTFDLRSLLAASHRPSCIA